MWFREGKFKILPLCPLSGNIFWQDCIVVSFPTTSTYLCHSEEGRMRWLFPRRNCFCPSYALGHSARAVLWLLLRYSFCWGHGGHGTTLAATVPVLPLIHPLLLIPICPPSDVRMHVSLRHVSVLRGDSLLSYSFPTCKFKGRNYCFSLCHDILRFFFWLMCYLEACGLTSKYFGIF